MEITQELKKDLEKFSLILEALGYEDGVEFNVYYYGDWDEIEGPRHNGRNIPTLKQVPQSLLDFINDIINEFDTELFYDDFDDSYYGNLVVELNVKDREFNITYEYNVTEVENYNIERTFNEVVEENDPWNRVNSKKKLNDEKFVSDMEISYGEYAVLTYEGSGDDGWILDQMETGNGSVITNSLLEEVAYEIISLYFGGWENNSGSSGTIEFNFKEKEINLNHDSNLQDIHVGKYKRINF